MHQLPEAAASEPDVLPQHHTDVPGDDRSETRSHLCRVLKEGGGRGRDGGREGRRGEDVAKVPCVYV
jgi:hypothetical protein